MLGNNCNSRSTDEIITLLHTFKTELEAVLSRESILENAKIRSYFDSEVMGISLHSILELKRFKRFEKDFHKLFDSKQSGEHTDQDKENNKDDCDRFSNKDGAVNLSTKEKNLLSPRYYRELMHATLLAATISPRLDICAVGGSEIKKTEIISFNFKIERTRCELDLGQVTEELNNFIRNFGARRIYVKPKLDGERTTLILRDLADGTSISEEELCELLINCPQISEFDDKGDGVSSCVLGVKREIDGTWFITLINEELTKEVVLWLREQTVRGKKLKVGVKSEHKIASFLSMISNSGEQHFKLLADDSNNSKQIQTNMLAPGPPRDDNVATGVCSDRSSETEHVVTSSPPCHPFTGVTLNNNKNAPQLEAPIPPPQGENGFNINTNTGGEEIKTGGKSRKNKRKNKKKDVKAKPDDCVNINGHHYLQSAQQYPPHIFYRHPSGAHFLPADTGFGIGPGMNDVSSQVSPRGPPQPTMFKTGMGNSCFVMPFSRVSAPALLQRGAAFLGNSIANNGLGDFTICNTGPFKENDNEKENDCKRIGKYGGCNTGLVAPDKEFAVNHIQRLNNRNNPHYSGFVGEVCDKGTASDDNIHTRRRLGPKDMNSARYYDQGPDYIQASHNGGAYLGSSGSQGHDYSGAHSNVSNDSSRTARITNLDPREGLHDVRKTVLEAKRKLLEMRVASDNYFAMNGSCFPRNFIGNGIQNFEDFEVKRLCFNDVPRINHSSQHLNRLGCNSQLQPHYSDHHVNGVHPQLRPGMEVGRNLYEQERLSRLPFNAPVTGFPLKRCSNCELVVALYKRLCSRFTQGSGQQQYEDFLVRLLMRELIGVNLGSADGNVNKKNFEVCIKVNGNDKKTGNGCSNYGSNSHFNTETRDMYITNPVLRIDAANFKNKNNDLSKDKSDVNKKKKNKKKAKCVSQKVDSGKGATLNANASENKKKSNGKTTKIPSKSNAAVPTVHGESLCPSGGRDEFVGRVDAGSDECGVYEEEESCVSETEGCKENVSRENSKQRTCQLTGEVSHREDREEEYVDAGYHKFEQEGEEVYDEYGEGNDNENESGGNNKSFIAESGASLRESKRAGAENFPSISETIIHKK
ncbi:hypothetical protein FG386_003129 [Cryptosporidium ryanae]|uniref:uncharacterized protein n=1 Tax=Cryptosporidium ryanae TaxID=515981 RepID=UPI003519DCC2|nr:hypothetical protein FG386_003129 [Cryptosporidium ryanae]